jgi:ribonuclease HII
MKKKRYILGIDEAGRGAVLGPMVISGVLFEDRPDVFDVLTSHNVRDSKLLTADKRRELARLVRKLKSRSLTIKISPSRIDETSLNVLEIESSARIVNRLNPHEVYLDVPATGRGVARYIQAIERLCRVPKVQFSGGNRYDATNIVVASASIIAKEAREAAVRRLHRHYGNFGSGYAHDPRTRTWLSSWKKNNERWPSIVRTKWSTVTKV